METGKECLIRTIQLKWESRTGTQVFIGVFTMHGRWREQNSLMSTERQDSTIAVLVSAPQNQQVCNSGAQLRIG